MGGESTDRSIRVTATVLKGKQLGQVEEGQQKGSSPGQPTSHNPSPQRSPEHSHRSPQRSQRSGGTKLQASQVSRGGEGDNKKSASSGQKPLERSGSSMKKSRLQDTHELPHSSQLEAAARALLARANEVESKMARRTLDVMVGEALRRKTAEYTGKASMIHDLVRDWDPNRDGHISKMEFRTNIRSLLSDSSVETSKIDELFSSLDGDRR